MIRFLTICMLCLLFTAAVWAKDQNSPQSLMTRSDGIYYYPTVQGLSDLAVDLVIDQLAGDKDLKDVKVTFYYAGKDRQQYDVTDLTAQNEDWRPKILATVSEFADFIVPRTSVASFKGLTVKSEKVFRQFLGSPETEYYQLVGSAVDKNADIQELQVLFDKKGLIYELETKGKDGNPAIVRVENSRYGDKWQISKMSMCMLPDKDPVWKIVTIDYATVDGYSLPTYIAVRQRTNINQPVNGGDLDIHFRNYRINKGVAAEFLPPPAKEAPTTAVPVQPAAPTPAATDSAKPQSSPNP